MIKAILFDLDQTLLDRDRLYRLFAEDLLQAVLPADVPAEAYQDTLEMLIRADDHGYGKKPDIYGPFIARWQLDLTIPQIIERWTAFTADHTFPYPQTEPVLEQLKTRYRLGAITNGEYEIQSNKLNSSGIGRYFETVVISGGVGIEKPDPRIFTDTLAQMQISSDEAVYVGDQWINDVTGALGAGMRAVWVHREKDRELPDEVSRIESIARLPDLLEALDEAVPESWPETLVRWYLQNGRDLPWRHTKDPYRIWVSEIMLQQTRVEAVIDYYHRFMEQFPSIEALADAPEEAVLKAWEGLGYYSRVRNLKKAAEALKRANNGVFPPSYEAIRALPGIGDYTAGAITSIAFDQPYPAVDGNVLRVFARLYAIPDDILKGSVRSRITRLDAAHIPEQAPGAFTQALMDLGAGICIPQNPRCSACPIAESCRARMMGMEDRLPYRAPKSPQKEVARQVFLLWNRGRILMTRRPAKGVLAGLWEFPGVDAGSVEEGQQAFAAQYGAVLPETRSVMTASHTFTHIRWQMEVSEAAVPDDFCVTGTNSAWMDAQDLQEAMIPSAFRAILGHVFESPCLETLR